MSFSIERALPRPRFHFTSLRVPALPLALAVFAALWLPMLFASPAPLSSDESLYLAEAHAIAWGEGFAYPSGEAITHRAPLYPLALAYGVALGGEDGAYAIAKAIVVVNALLVALIAWRIGGGIAGFAAGFAASASAYLGGLGTTLYLDPLQCTFLLAALLALVRALERPDIRWFAAAGAMTGLAFLVKESAVQWAPLGVAVWLGLRSMRTSVGVRGAMVFTMAFAASVAPWWVWVYVQTSEFFLLGRPSPLAASALIAAAVLFAAYAVASATFSNGSYARRFARFAPAACVLLVAAWCVFMLVGLTRFSTWPYPNVYAHTIPDYLTSVAPQAQPYFLLVAAWGVAVWRALRGHDAMRLLALVALLFAPFAIFAANRGLQLRDALPLVYLSYIVLGVAVPWLLARARTLPDIPYAVQMASAGIAIAAIALAVHQSAEFRDRESNAVASEPGAVDWDSPFARDIAGWMSVNMPRGARVLSSRLYFSSLYIHTEGQFSIRQMPTVRVDIDRERNGLIAPASNLFRWEDRALRPSSATDTWLQLRQYPGKDYWIGLRQQELLAYLADHEIDYVVLTGDDGVFSSLQYAPYFTGHQAFTLVHESAPSSSEHAFVYRVNRDALTPIAHSTAISPHDAAVLERETGMALDLIANALGTPMRITDVELGLSPREADAALTGVDLGMP